MVHSNYVKSWRSTVIIRIMKMLLGRQWMWCEDNGARWTEKVNQVRFDKRINHIFSKKDTMPDIDKKVQERRWLDKIEYLRR